MSTNPKVIRWLWAMKRPKAIAWYISTYFYSEEEIAQLFSENKKIKLEWSKQEFDT